MLLIAVIACIVQTAQAQTRNFKNQSIGVRLGEPFGLTYKNYLTRSSSFELGLGTGSTGWNGNYYQRSFDNKGRYNGYAYTSHSVDNTLYFQARYLRNYQVPVEGVEGRFDWYWGIGGMLKVARINYYYQNELPPFPGYTDSRTDIDIGPEGILGAEYRFEDLPITLFAEVSLMLEVADQFGSLRGFFGTGARYNF
jgi:hypothetical protein